MQPLKIGLWRNTYSQVPKFKKKYAIKQYMLYDAILQVYYIVYLQVYISVMSCILVRWRGRGRSLCQPYYIIFLLCTQKNNISQTSCRQVGHSVNSGQWNVGKVIYLQAWIQKILGNPLSLLLNGQMMQKIELKTLRLWGQRHSQMEESWVLSHCLKRSHQKGLPIQEYLTMCE